MRSYFLFKDPSSVPVLEGRRVVQHFAWILLFWLSFDLEAVELDNAALLSRFVEELILIEPGKGKFHAAFANADGKPVEPTRPFRISRYETPQNLYEGVMGKNPSQWKGPRNSVEMTSYDDAIAFCVKLTEMLHKEKLLTVDEVVALPTEREWDYCARAGTTTAYSFGDEEAKLGEFGWFHGNAAGNDPPVGAKKPNPWGLFDIHGYLWEWCTPESAAGQAPARGGAWTSSAKECRTASRALYPRDRRAPDLGFRCVVRRISAQRE